MSLRHLALAAVCAAAVSAPAFADTTVTLLHVSEDKNAQALWGQIAKDYEAAHPGVKVEVKYLENEAFKASCRPCCRRTSRGQVCSTAGAAGSCRLKTRRDS